MNYEKCNKDAVEYRIKETTLRLFYPRALVEHGDA